jgi:hypothetical protein
MQQVHKLFDAETRVSDDRTQSTPIEFAMIGNNHLCEGFVTPEDYVTALPSFDIETGFLKSSNTLVTGDSGQFAHTATTRTSNLSSGTAKPSSSRAAT